MSAVTHRSIETNGIRMHIAERGAGPLIVLLHGFPESWYSWRHQLAALADAGYRAVAPDQRGYGQTDRPAEVARYTQLHLVGDVVGLLDALGEERAVVVGHDWGAPVAWNTALLRPDRIRGVVGLSVPYTPRGCRRCTSPASGAWWSTSRACGNCSPDCGPSSPTCGARSCCPAAATGPSRSARPRSTRRCWSSCAGSSAPASGGVPTGRIHW